MERSSFFVQIQLIQMLIQLIQRWVQLIQHRVQLSSSWVQLFLPKDCKIEEKRERFHIPPFFARRPLYKGIERGGTYLEVPPRFHPSSTLCLLNKRKDRCSYFSQPIGICVLRVIHYLYCLFQFLRTHSHIPEGSNTKSVARYIIDDLVIVIDDRGTITYLSVG